MRIGGGVSASVELFAGANQAQIAAATLTLDETLARYLHTVAALYGFDGTDLRRLLVESTTNPNLRAALYNGATLIGQGATPAEALANPTSILDVVAREHIWNGSTWDRAQGPINRTDVASAARTANGTSGTLANRNGRSIRGLMDVTAVSGTTPTMDVALNWDMATNTYTAIETSDQVTATGVRTWEIGLGVTELTTGVARRLSRVMPASYIWSWTIGGTTPSFTFIIEASLN